MSGASLSRAQRELLNEFAHGRDDDRRVNGRYLRTADILAAKGLLRACGLGWYEITAAGKQEVAKPT